MNIKHELLDIVLEKRKKVTGNKPVVCDPRERACNCKKIVVADQFEVVPVDPNHPALQRGAVCNIGFGCTDQGLTSEVMFRSYVNKVSNFVQKPSGSSPYDLITLDYAGVLVASLFRMKDTDLFGWNSAERYWYNKESKMPVCFFHNNGLAPMPEIMGLYNDSLSVGEVEPG